MNTSIQNIRRSKKKKEIQNDIMTPVINAQKEPPPLVLITRMDYCLKKNIVYIFMNKNPE